MAWTVPRTVVAGDVFTTAIWNTDLRDNLLASEMALVTAAAQTIAATGPNAVAARQVSWARVATSEALVSGTNVDLATAGPSVTMTTGPNALVAVTCTMANGTLGGFSTMNYTVSGATTFTSSYSVLNFRAELPNDQIRFSGFDYVSTLNAGSNTFKAVYSSSGGTSTFVDRQIFVWPIG